MKKISVDEFKSYIKKPGFHFMGDITLYSFSHLKKFFSDVIDQVQHGDYDTLPTKVAAQGLKEASIYKEDTGAHIVFVVWRKSKRAEFYIFEQWARG